MKKRRQRSRKSGFTLMEVLLVLVILVILGSMVGVWIRGAQKTAFADSAQSQIMLFKQALESYQLDLAAYPQTEDGLQALIQPPSSLPNPKRWRRRYLDALQVPLDPWGNQYDYKLVNADEYVITSFGPDMQQGTADDITSQPAVQQ